MVFLKIFFAQKKDQKKVTSGSANEINLEYGIPVLESKNSLGIQASFMLRAIIWSNYMGHIAS